ncbi:MAG: PEP-CTERM sorting domain-containing protein [Alphaproteobacteria bacterium]
MGTAPADLRAQTAVSSVNQQIAEFPGTVLGADTFSDGSSIFALGDAGETAVDSAEEPAAGTETVTGTDGEQQAGGGADEAPADSQPLEETTEAPEAPEAAGTAETAEAGTGGTEAVSASTGLNREEMNQLIDAQTGTFGSAGEAPEEVEQETAADVGGGAESTSDETVAPTDGTSETQPGETAAAEAEVTEAEPAGSSREELLQARLREIFPQENEPETAAEEGAAGDSTAQEGAAETGGAAQDEPAAPADEVASDPAGDVAAAGETANAPDGDSGTSRRQILQAQLSEVFAENTEADAGPEEGATTDATADATAAEGGSADPAAEDAGATDAGTNDTSAPADEIASDQSGDVAAGADAANAPDGNGGTSRRELLLAQLDELFGENPENTEPEAAPEENGATEAAPSDAESPAEEPAGDATAEPASEGGATAAAPSGDSSGRDAILQTQLQEILGAPAADGPVEDGGVNDDFAGLMATENMAATASPTIGGTQGGLLRTRVRNSSSGPNQVSASAPGNGEPESGEEVVAAAPDEGPSETEEDLVQATPQQVTDGEMAAARSREVPEEMDEMIGVQPREDTDGVDEVLGSDPREPEESSMAPMNTSSPAASEERAVSSVPEPATWLMMILGFWAVAWRLRRRDRERRMPVPA